MPASRIVKEHDERRAEILDAAGTLFSEAGYEATSVNAIIDRIGISKGTFYYYFASKEELLDSLIGRVTDVVLERAHEAVAAEKGDALAKLNAFFAVASRWKAANAGIVVAFVDALYRNENVLVCHKMERRFVAASVSELAAIIEEGTRQGVFRVEDAHDTAEVVVQMVVALRQIVACLVLELAEKADAWPALERKIRCLEEAVARVLGAPDGSVKLADEQALLALKGSLTKRSPSEGAAV